MHYLTPDTPLMVGYTISHLSLLVFDDKMCFSKLLFQSTEFVSCFLLGLCFAEIKCHDENFVRFSAAAGARRSYETKQ